MCGELLIMAVILHYFVIRHSVVISPTATQTPPNPDPPLRVASGALLEHQTGNLSLPLAAE